MKPDEAIVNNYTSGSNTYSIPVFQRPYEWESEKWFYLGHILNFQRGLSHLRYRKFVVISSIWFLAFNLPVAVAERFTEEKEFPPYNWVDKTPRKYKECTAYSSCIKLELDQKWVRSYFENEYLPFIFIRVAYYDNKKRLLGTGADTLYPHSQTKVSQDGKIIKPKAYYFHPTAPRSKFSTVVISEIITR